MSVNARSSCVRSAATNSRTLYTLRCGAANISPSWSLSAMREDSEGSVTQRLLLIVYCKSLSPQPPYRPQHQRQNHAQQDRSHQRKVKCRVLAANYDVAWEVSDGQT